MYWCQDHIRGYDSMCYRPCCSILWCGPSINTHRAVNSTCGVRWPNSMGLYWWERKSQFSKFKIFIYFFYLKYYRFFLKKSNFYSPLNLYKYYSLSYFVPHYNISFLLIFVKKIFSLLTQNLQELARKKNPKT